MVLVLQTKSSIVFERQWIGWLAGSMSPAMPPRVNGSSGCCKAVFVMQLLLYCGIVAKRRRGDMSSAA
jgi:hypothetical protein